jgi:NADH-quinone oxidoreductase subunit N
LTFAPDASGHKIITDIAFLFLFVSLSIKIAIVPFHFWAPDVYEGTPTLFTAVMATVVKLAAFGALIRIIQANQTILPEWMDWFFILMVLLTLVYGNILAMKQQSVKRLLAYSSIVQAGFILIGFIQLDNNTALILNYYLLAYILSSLVCFIIVHFVEQQNGSDDLESFAGLFARNRTLAVLMSIALISLAGGPFTAGFIAKLFVLQHSVLQGYISLVVIAVLCTLISVYYYYKVINVMFNESSHPKWHTPFVYKGLLTVFVILILVAGIVPVFFTQYLK